ncbi:type II toxin-antitoxin system HicB family antitoxin [Adlercreutzia sp. ZJ473]|uniref:type II toxin-antitoxin system HicB family antitoxin n=1 Tax=Adlercreutzia sp. ZJ473 TaxID=2722822 RepID=UPI0015532F09|nr:type II toxin-antitoxin system HicB family antitoxin [Adlercreutzia sp. ZJ473]
MGKYIYDAVFHAAEEGGYWADAPDLPGCVSEGDTINEAASMMADAMKTYVASLLLHGDEVPVSHIGHEADDGEIVIAVFFETDESYVIRGKVVSAAQAARDLGVSAGRVTHMIDAGLLDGYRSGRRTYVSVESIKKRKADPRSAGRPRKEALQG